jgi:alkane 1-monooxygenase
MSSTAISIKSKLVISVYCLGFLFGYLFFWWPVLILDDFSRWPWLIPAATFIAIPLLDLIFGEYRHNWTEQEQHWIKTQIWFRWLPLLSLPSFLWYQVLMVNYALEADSILATFGWVMSCGIAGGVMAITVGHELIHRKTKWEQRSGGALLAMVAYGSFKVEHIYGHHVHVATPKDMTTAPKGMTVYRFWWRALFKTPRLAYQIAEQRRQKKNARVNEFVILYGVSAGFLLCALFFFGWAGVLFWVLQSLVAILLLETVNYIEHYGLLREHKGERYESTNHMHSWNSSRLVTNFLLFNLQRHSDHHAHASRAYPVLRHFDDSPQMPQGYAAMILLSLIPKFWFKVMDDLLPAK